MLKPHSPAGTGYPAQRPSDVVPECDTIPVLYEQLRKLAYMGHMVVIILHGIPLAREDGPLLLDEHLPTLPVAHVNSAIEAPIDIAAHNFHPWLIELETIVLIL